MLVFRRISEEGSSRYKRFSTKQMVAILRRQIAIFVGSDWQP
jgi:hypothetical protein